MSYIEINRDGTAATVCTGDPCHHQSGAWRTVKFWFFEKRVFVCASCLEVLSPKDKQMFDGWTPKNPVRTVEFVERIQTSPPQFACLHDLCPECEGTGVRRGGGPCVHQIACPCPRHSVR